MITSIENYLRELLERGPQPVLPLDRAKPVVVYGAGSCGRDVARVLKNAGYQVLGFLDKSRQEKRAIDGLPCFYPRTIESRDWRDEDAQIVIGVWNCGAPLHEIEDELKRLHWKNVWNFSQFYALFSAELGERFWLAPREFYARDEVKNEIAECLGLWSDETSRRLFSLAIEARLSGDMRALNAEFASEIGPQYFSRTVENWPIPKRFVDCGALDGDTLRELDWTQLEAVAAFEPDAGNFARLSDWCRENASASTCTALWPCAVWNNPEMLSFAGDNGGASKIGAGETTVCAVKLDDVLAGFAPDFLKMDIEGAEPNALEGARKIIEKHRPALAICVYHRPEHLWQIARQIADWNLGYRFSLRAHGANGFDWVLYARV